MIGIMYKVKGDSWRLERSVTEGAGVQLRKTFVDVAFFRDLLKWWNSPGRIRKGKQKPGSWLAE